jgi:hypothetical protein
LQQAEDVLRLRVHPQPVEEMAFGVPQREEKNSSEEEAKECNNLLNES